MKLIRRGVHRTPEYRLFFKTPDGFISPLHDIPLYSDFENKIFNVIVENQMLEMKKNMKLHLGEALNPLRQITTKRFYPWNDGVFPQTWDNTSELDPQVKHIVGHPMHFMDIGSKDVKRGEIIQVRALGVLGVELKGNMYWKVVVINVRDKKAHRMTDLRHVEENFPGYLQNTVKSYNYWEKTSFAKVRDGKYALKMIEKMHAQWLKMVHGKFKCPGVSKINTCLEGSPNKISCQEAEKEFKKKTKPSQPRPNVYTLSPHESSEHLNRPKRSYYNADSSDSDYSSEEDYSSSSEEHSTTPPPSDEDDDDDDDDDENFIDPYNLTIKAIEQGTPNTTEHRIYFKSQHGFVSPLNDIPLFVNLSQHVFNMVVEIPKGTNAKMSMSLGEALNPIKHEMVNDEHPRYVHLAHVTPHHGYIWNYGALPNTWENPSENEAHTGYKGDGNPMDVVEIGDRVAKRGEILQVQCLGALALIVDGKIDYKIIAIDVKDPKAAKLHDIQDVEKYFPGRMKATVDWFEHHNVPAGMQKNQLAFNGQFKNREFANNVTQKSFFKWMLLSIKKVENPGISLTNTISGDDYAQGKISFEEAEEIVNKRKSKPDRSKKQKKS
ncbi:hypothetical protein WDU94_000368 [Cyamophila willieti]